MDARGGESNSQHVLFCGDVFRGRDAVQITHVAEKREGREEFFFITALTQETGTGGILPVFTSHPCKTN